MTHTNLRFAIGKKAVPLGQEPTHMDKLKKKTKFMYAVWRIRTQTVTFRVQNVSWDVKIRLKASWDVKFHASTGGGVAGFRSSSGQNVKYITEFLIRTLSKSEHTTYSVVHFSWSSVYLLGFTGNEMKLFWLFVLDNLKPLKVILDAVMFMSIWSNRLESSRSASAIAFTTGTSQCVEGRRPSAQLALPSAQACADGSRRHNNVPA
jgi:hypothetical protein